MPANSEKQKRFFFLVKGVQAGKISPKRVGSKVTKAAKGMSTKDVDDFTHSKKLTKEKLSEIIKLLNGLKNEDVVSPIEPMNLEEDESDQTEKNPIAKTFQQKGNFDQYIQQFSGLEMKPKEMESISNYTKTKPTKQDKFFVRYESTDDFNNNTITVIKKLREGNDLVFTAFQSNSSQNDDPNTQNDIVVNKSISFKDEIEGGNVLSNMLLKLEI
jgi:hypothetical protein